MLVHAAAAEQFATKLFMALHKAIEFVQRVGIDGSLRKACNSSPSKPELLESLGFDLTEFEDAINMQLVKCQSYEEAEVFQQIRMWFAIL